MTDVDTEAAEVWRGLSEPARDALMGVSPRLRKRGYSAATFALLNRRGLRAAGGVTDLGKRVAAYGRSQTG